MNARVSPKTMVAVSAPRGAGLPRATDVLQILVLVAEILLMAQALVGRTWEMLALGHFGITVGLTVAIAALERARTDSGALQVFTLLTFAGGPIGAAAAMLGQQQIGHSMGGGLDKWYNTIAPAAVPAVTLVDMIIDGRLVHQESRLPRPYDALLTSGTMQEKQALLAYLAIEDDEKFVEVALALALRSPDQRVRVQAAAVAAHTRARSRRMLAGIAMAQAAPAGAATI